MVLAQGLTTQSSTARHAVGQIYDDELTGARYIYCVDSGSGSAQYKTVYITPTTFATALLTKAAADLGYKVGVPQIAVTADYYYWCMIRSGNTTPYVHSASACASEATLFTTSTAGRIDDSATSQTGISGIRLTATAATAAASANAACWIDDPIAMSVDSSYDVAESMAESAATLANHGLAADSAGTSAALISTTASNAQASATAISNVSAGSMATSVGRWGLAISTYVSVVSAGSVSESGASVAKNSYPTEGNALSTMISCFKSTG